MVISTVGHLLNKREQANLFNEIPYEDARRFCEEGMVPFGYGLCDHNVGDSVRSLLM
jgi:hypothetical protein